MRVSGRAAARRAGPGGAALLSSVALHAGLAGAVWFSGLFSASPLPPMKVYRVSIVSPPPLEAGPPQPVAANPPAVTRPRPEEPSPKPVQQTEPKPAPKPAPKVETAAPPKPEPKKAEPKTEVVRPKPEEKPVERKPAGARPDPNARVGGDGLNVQIDGETFPFPGYLENILSQISRYFRWTGAAGLNAEVYFIILRDGSVEEIRILRRSGDVAFDLEAMAAIEQAGRRRAFGALPDGFRGDRLPVSFYFEPAR